MGHILDGGLSLEPETKPLNNQQLLTVKIREVARPLRSVGKRVSQTLSAVVGNSGGGNTAAPLPASPAQAVVTAQPPVNSAQPPSASKSSLLSTLGDLGVTNTATKQPLFQSRSTPKVRYNRVPYESPALLLTRNSLRRWPWSLNLS
jgi:hypothetical protein